jgi:hypothetical protein
MPVANPKNLPTSAVAGDLGIAAMMNPDRVEELQTKKKQDLLAQREGMMSPGELLGAVADIFGITK